MFSTGELQEIRSRKHPGAVFIKFKNTKSRFLCKFYPYPNGNEATEDVQRFMKLWNSNYETQ